MHAQTNQVVRDSVCLIPLLVCDNGNALPYPPTGPICVRCQTTYYYYMYGLSERN